MRPLISADTGRCNRPMFFFSIIVVLVKLDKLVHKYNCSHDFLFYIINYSIIIVQVSYITIETKEVARISYNGFLFPHEYSGEGIVYCFLQSPP